MFKTLCVCCKYMFMASTFLYQCGLVSASTRGVAESISDGNVVFWQVWCSALRFILKDNVLNFFGHLHTYNNRSVFSWWLEVPAFSGGCANDVDVALISWSQWGCFTLLGNIDVWGDMRFLKKKFHKRIDSNRLNIRWLYDSLVIILMFCLKKRWEYIWLIGNKVLTLHSQTRNKRYIAEWSSW